MKYSEWEAFYQTGIYSFPSKQSAEKKETTMMACRGHWLSVVHASFVWKILRFRWTVCAFLSTSVGTCLYEWALRTHLDAAGDNERCQKEEQPWHPLFLLVVLEEGRLQDEGGFTSWGGLSTLATPPEWHRDTQSIKVHWKHINLALMAISNQMSTTGKLWAASNGAIIPNLEGRQRENVK